MKEEGSRVPPQEGFRPAAASTSWSEEGSVRTRKRLARAAAAALEESTSWPEGGSVRTRKGWLPWSMVAFGFVSTTAMLVVLSWKAPQSWALSFVMMFVMMVVGMLPFTLYNLSSLRSMRLEQRQVTDAVLRMGLVDKHAREAVVADLRESLREEVQQAVTTNLERVLAAPRGGAESSPVLKEKVRLQIDPRLPEEAQQIIKAEFRRIFSRA